MAVTFCRSALIFSTSAGAFSPAIADEGAAPPRSVSYRRLWKSFRSSLKASLPRPDWEALKSEPLMLHEMRPHHVGEEHQGFIKAGTARIARTYLRTEAERAPFWLTLGEDGRFYDYQGHRFDTGGHKVPLSMDPAGHIYARNFPDDEVREQYKHSSYTAGGPVLMAADVRFADGLLTFAVNRSGHYRPWRRSFIKWLLLLESVHADLSQLEMDFDRKSRPDILAP